MLSKLMCSKRSDLFFVSCQFILSDKIAQILGFLHVPPFLLPSKCFILKAFENIEGQSRKRKGTFVSFISFLFISHR